jgi:hypothetical protein
MAPNLCQSNALRITPSSSKTSWLIRGQRRSDDGRITGKRNAPICNERTCMIRTRPPSVLARPDDHRERRDSEEIGLGHYEGRGWRGFHHHRALCIAAYGFLFSERETIPPSGPPSARRFAKPAISSGCRPRGAAAPSPTAHPQLNRDRPLRNGWSQSQGCCRAVHAAPADFHETCDEIYDAVVLDDRFHESCHFGGDSFRFYVRRAECATTTDTIGERCAG